MIIIIVIIIIVVVVSWVVEIYGEIYDDKTYRKYEKLVGLSILFFILLLVMIYTFYMVYIGFKKIRGYHKFIMDQIERKKVEDFEKSIRVKMMKKDNIYLN